MVVTRRTLKVTYVICSHGSKVTLYKLYATEDGQPLRLHMDG